MIENEKEMDPKDPEKRNKNQIDKLKTITKIKGQFKRKSKFIKHKIILIFVLHFLFTIEMQNLLNIYIIAHRDFPLKINNKAYKILCDEKSQLKRKYNLTIIETNKENPLTLKRRGYSECSKMYYIWRFYKKGYLSSKYVGFAHYRRLFRFKDNIPNLDLIFSKYDAILKSLTKTYASMRANFNYAHLGRFMDEVVAIIKEKFPEYYPSALYFLSHNVVSYCNIFIMKKKDFIKWGEFVFGVLLEFDRRHKLKTDRDIEQLVRCELIRIHRRTDGYFGVKYQSRLQGFIIERVTNMFYVKHFKKNYYIGTAA